jgi:hypothetical protein
MAAIADILALRRLVAEPDDVNGYDNTRLAELLDTPLTVNAAAAVVWREKAANAAELVDVSESGSSRKLSDIRKNALEMAAHYSALDESAGEGPAGSGPVIMRIRRGFS